ncbi:hypothetical protein [Desulfoluna butyratoxydans]|uniref:Uncharacterized protein n=1 Tax=Desulfoluna butyratoxydans TaxID=231438 RepID=A0A4U8YPN4_9BACT|nr:hypothetical protein [Desulfoluna butyratoxydans]VFQ45199.1 hypothetical protein MSL71_28560 [Desulfoluna butyratoxydans]
MAAGYDLESAFSHVIETMRGDFVPRVHYNKLQRQVDRLEDQMRILSRQLARVERKLPGGGRRKGASAASKEKNKPTKRTYRADYLKMMELLQSNPDKEFTLKELIDGTGFNEKKVRNMVFIYSRDKFGYVQVIRRGVYKAGKPVVASTDEKAFPKELLKEEPAVEVEE